MPYHPTKHDIFDPLWRPSSPDDHSLSPEPAPHPPWLQNALQRQHSLSPPPSSPPDAHQHERSLPALRQFWVELATLEGEVGDPRNVPKIHFLHISILGTTATHWPSVFVGLQLPRAESPYSYSALDRAIEQACSWLAKLMVHEDVKRMMRDEKRCHDLLSTLEAVEEAAARVHGGLKGPLKGAIEEDNENIEALNVGLDTLEKGLKHLVEQDPTGHLHHLLDVYGLNHVLQHSPHSHRNSPRCSTSPAHHNSLAKAASGAGSARRSRAEAFIAGSRAVQATVQAFRSAET